MDHSRFPSPLLRAAHGQSSTVSAVAACPWIGPCAFVVPREYLPIEPVAFHAEPERIERPSHELGCAPGALPARPFLPHYAPKSRCFACGGDVRADWRCSFCGRDNG